MKKDLARTDNLSPAQRRKTMAAVKSFDTLPEIIVRSLVKEAGLSCAHKASPLPGRPDIVFPGLRKAIFVNGCFWHGHDCKSGRKRPRSNVAYWDAKLKRNKSRDRRVLRELRAKGWECVTIWECQLRQSKRVLQRIRQSTMIEVSRRRSLETGHAQHRQRSCYTSL
jgi:DNA mismatch endonuclease, patch repair protein